MLQVLHNKGPQSGSNITKQQDELAYLKFVEDLCRFSFSSSQCYPFLLCVRTCLHKSFLTNPRLLDAVLQGVRTCITKLKENSLSSSGDAQQLPETQAHFEFLAFAMERLEAKVTAKDTSAILDKSTVTE